MTSKNTVTDDDNKDVVVLGHHPSGIDSLRKLVQGFCGGGGGLLLFKDAEVWDSKPDWGKAVAEGTVASEDEVALDTKEDDTPPQTTTSREISMSTPTEVCTVTVETNTSSDVSALLEEKPASNEDLQEINVEQDGSKETKNERSSAEVVSDDLAEDREAVEVVTRGMAIEVEPEAKNDAYESNSNAAKDLKSVEITPATTEEDEPISEPEAPKQRSGMCSVVAFVLCWTLLLVSFTQPAFLFENDDFQLDFSQEGIKNLGLKLQQLVEKELVQSTGSFINLNQVVEETVEESAVEETIDANVGVEEEEDRPEAGDEPVVINDENTADDESVRVEVDTESSTETIEVVESSGKSEGTVNKASEEISQNTVEEVGPEELEQLVDAVNGTKEEEQLVNDIEKESATNTKAAPVAESSKSNGDTKKVPLAFVKVPAKTGDVASDAKEEL